MARELQLQETDMLEQTPQIPAHQQNPQTPEVDELTTYTFNDLLDLNFRLQAELQRRQAVDLEALRIPAKPPTDSGINPPGDSGDKPPTDSGVIPPGGAGLAGYRM